VPSGPRPPWRWRCGWRCGKAGGAKADQAERDAERADRDAAQARLVTVEPTYPETGYCQEIFIVVKCPFTGPVELGRCAGFDLGGPCRRVGLILGL